MTIAEVLRQLDAQGFPPDEVNVIVNMIADEAIVAVAAPLALELGLRWLHDRAVGGTEGKGGLDDNVSSLD